MAPYTVTTGGLPQEVDETGLFSRLKCDHCNMVIVVHDVFDPSTSLGMIVGKHVGKGVAIDPAAPIVTIILEKGTINTDKVDADTYASNLYAALTVLEHRASMIISMGGDDSDESVNWIKQVNTALKRMESGCERKVYTDAGAAGFSARNNESGGSKTHRRQSAASMIKESQTTKKSLKSVKGAYLLQHIRPLVTTEITTTSGKVINIQNAWHVHVFDEGKKKNKRVVVVDLITNPYENSGTLTPAQMVAVEQAIKANMEVERDANGVPIEKTVKIMYNYISLEEALKNELDAEFGVFEEIGDDYERESKDDLYLSYTVHVDRRDADGKIPVRLQVRHAMKTLLGFPDIEERVLKDMLQGIQSSFTTILAGISGYDISFLNLQFVRVDKNGTETFVDNVLASRK